ncbi:Autophagy-related protein 3 [Kalmanozyma brasiliensis GHG001]|uniref:Autophagy-related protein 3 n=1 Tax=Kalmanozyma brasiliensis (strain GHG001) TaxID=1365824 RepID=V5F0I2_KALBG|nr:Autophagy-related protein 3 [Kalmanozyma brasiliensis GHG001]EST09813.1 Autophagy-related protein 3 [Kalmanozyma brasiliensis GHG001]
MNTLQTHFWAVRDYLSPVLRESKFKEHGRITPEEFVAAGDFLSYKFPTWQWCAGSSSKARDYLPKDKQFLISCGVPSLRRVSQIEKGVGVGVNDDDEKLMSFDEGAADAAEDDQWVATHFDEQQAGSNHRAADMIDIPDIGEDQAAPEHQLTEGQEDDLASRVAGVSITPSSSNLEASASGTDIGDIPDMPDIPDMDDETDDLAGGVVEEDDPATAAPPTLPTSTSTTAAGGGDNSKLISVRKYDCIITYDKYYQTPRMWLVGYDEHGVPLKPAQIFEDVSSDYAQKTVTIEPFPHGHAGPDSSATSNASAVGVATASIHPCKHASVMKKVIERMNASVIEEQRKAAAASGGATAGGEKKKKKGWSVSSAVKRVTGSGAEGKTPATAEGKDAGNATNEAAGEEEEVEGLRVDQYMIIFLKFMASIVPAIEIDATQAL